MSYTIETTKELFLVTKHYGENDDLHIIMSKKEVQEELKSPLAHLIIDIQALGISPVKRVSKKYFLPKNWEKANKTSLTYRIWKEISESED